MMKITNNNKCYFCTETEVLQEHHIVPKEYGGCDREENLVKVCPNCHNKLHDLHDDRFYAELISLGLPEAERPQNRPTGGRISNAISAAKLQVHLAIKWEKKLFNDDKDVKNLEKAHEHLRKVAGRY